MHLCFVDESGTPAKPGRDWPRFFVFGGVIIPEERWHGIRDKFVGLKRQKQYRGEVKWRYFAPANDDITNPMRDWDQDRRNDFRSSVFSIITGTKSIRLICGVCDAPLAYNLANVNDQEDIYFRTYKVVTERFQYFLQDVTIASGHETNGIIVGDHRNGPEDNRFRLQHDRLVRETGKYTSSYRNFIEGIFLSPSNMSVGIQLADMVAGAVWRFHEHSDGHWLDVIRQSFRMRSDGKIDGYGLMRFPKAGWTGPVID